MQEVRSYRNWCKHRDLVCFNVVVKESDIYILARKNLTRKAIKLVSKYRLIVEKYIERNPSFASSLEPVPVEGNAPLIVKEMAKAGKKVGVGPMAAVAGAIAEFVGRDLLDYSPEVIIENGGDIFMKSLKVRNIGIYAGNSSFTKKITLKILPQETPLGICTSSGTVGHSLSLGNSDAVIVISPSTSLADASATAIGNLIKNESDISQGIEFAQKVKGIKGILIIKDNKMGIWGNVKIS
ncbi:MAG: hypothetical protein COT09_00245 [Candidatus Hydromicrobium americanum]|nr:MAG: hypothetical protein COT09_00245 [Candidatus Hydromicrobium americanum]